MNNISGSYANLVTSGHNRGIENLSTEQQAELRSQLNELRAECEQLHNENASIKRMSKGTNLTAGSKRF